MTILTYHIVLLLLLSGLPEQPRELLSRSAQEFQAGNYDSAQGSILRLLASHPKLAPAHNLLGLVFMQKKKYEAALQEFDTALKLQPASAAAHVNRGNALVELHQDDKARLEYTTALKMRPEERRGAVWHGHDRGAGASRW